MLSRKRILILPFSAVVILALVSYKLTKTYPDPKAATYQTVVKGPVRPFQALNSYNRLVKLDAFLGRHTMILVFFDGAAGADRDETLQQIRNNYDRFKELDIIVLGISEALPQQNRKVFERSGEFPFPLLSDPAFELHRRWGLFDEQAGVANQGVFLVDRAGQVAWSGTRPKPLTRPSETIRQICKGI